MTSKARIRCEELREKLVEAEKARIYQNGLGDLWARDLAQNTGYALDEI